MGAVACIRTDHCCLILLLFKWYILTLRANSAVGENLWYIMYAFATYRYTCTSICYEMFYMYWLLTGCHGAFDAGTRSCHVHSVGYRHKLRTKYLHEKFGFSPNQREIKEAATRHELPVEEWGKSCYTLTRQSPTGINAFWQFTSTTSVIALAHYVEDNVAMIVQPL